MGPAYVCMHSINIIVHSYNNGRKHFFLFQGRRLGDKNMQIIDTFELDMKENVRAEYTKVMRLFRDLSNYIMQ